MSVIAGLSPSIMNSIRAYISPNHMCLGAYWKTDREFCWDTTIKICLISLVVEIVIDWEKLFDYDLHEWWVWSAYHTPKASIYEKPAPDDDDIPF